MGHKDDAGKTFGPGHNGWYAVSPRAVNKVFYEKANSAFAAAAQCGHTLTDAVCIPIIDKSLITQLEARE